MGSDCGMYYQIVQLKQATLVELPIGKRKQGDLEETGGFLGKELQGHILPIQFEAISSSMSRKRLSVDTCFKKRGGGYFRFGIS